MIAFFSGRNSQRLGNVSVTLGAEQVGYNQATDMTNICPQFHAPINVKDGVQAVVVQSAQQHMSTIGRSHSPKNLIVYLIPNRTVVRYPRRALPISDEREQALGRVLHVVVEVRRVAAGVGDILKVGKEGGVEGEDVGVGLGKGELGRREVRGLGRGGQGQGMALRYARRRATTHLHEAQRRYLALHDVIRQ